MGISQQSWLVYNATQPVISSFAAPTIRQANCIVQNGVKQLTEVATCAYVAYHLCQILLSLQTQLLLHIPFPAGMLCGYIPFCNVLVD